MKYRKDASVCPNNLISISVTISFSASWFISELDCRQVVLLASWLSANWIVGELDCRTSWIVGELFCRRVGLSESCPVTSVTIVSMFSLINAICVNIHYM